MNDRDYYKTKFKDEANRVLVYGPDRPKLSFTQDSDGAINFRFDSKRVINLPRSRDCLMWKHLRRPEGFHRKRGATPAEEVNAFVQLVDKLCDLTGSDSEKRLLRGYARECLTDMHFAHNKLEDRSVSVWDYPALVPQVWVNWLHFDSRDKHRAERAKTEPFRVDFVMKPVYPFRTGSPSSEPADLNDALKEVSRFRKNETLTIIEIDGPSHFGNYEVDAAGRTHLKASMEAYTRHLRKDRWLRKHGWEVYRLSSQEVEECENYWLLFSVLMDLWVRQESLT